MKKLFNNSNHHLILQNTKKLEIKHIRNHKKLFELSFHTSKTAKTQKKKYATWCKTVQSVISVILWFKNFKAKKNLKICQVFVFED